MSRGLSDSSMNSSVSCLEKADIRLTIRNIRLLTTYTSSQTYLNGIPWQVKLRKNGANVTVELCCNYEDPNPNWSCAARAIFKLMSFSPNSDIYERRQDAVAVFSSRIPSIARHSPLVTWQELFDSKRQYVSNDTIVVDVTVQAEKMRDSSESRLIKVEPLSGHAKIRFRLMKVKGVIAMDSPEFLFRNIKCQLTVTKRQPLTRKEIDEDKHGYLGAWLVSSNCFNTSEYDIQVIFRLLSPDGDHIEKPAERVTPNRFNFGARLMPLHKLYNSHYVQNDSITLEVDIKAQHIANNVAASSRSGGSDMRLSSIVMDCVLCYDNMIENDVIAATPCGHLFCSKCIIESLRIRPACPICNQYIRAEGIRQVFLPSIQAK